METEQFQHNGSPVCPLPRLRVLVPFVDTIQATLATDLAHRYTGGVATLLFAAPVGPAIHQCASAVCRAIGGPGSCRARLEGCIRTERPLDQSVVATSHDFDMVALMVGCSGSAGDDPCTRLARAILYRLPVPSLIARGALMRAKAERPHRLVVLLDGTTNAETALPMAIYLAGYHRVPILLLRIVDLGTLSAMPDLRQAALTRHHSYLRQIATDLIRQGVTADYEIGFGSPSFALMDHLVPDDLIVLTPRPMLGAARQLVGSLSAHLIRQAPCPVLLVPQCPRAIQAASGNAGWLVPNETDSLGVSPWFDS